MNCLFMDDLVKAGVIFESLNNLALFVSRSITSISPKANRVGDGACQRE
jgi:hypothetical protein